MKIIFKDFRKEGVKLKIDHLEDFWYLTYLIDQGDLVKAKTTRKIKIGNQTEKKTLTLTVKVEKVALGEEGLRIMGKTIEETEFIPKGSYHTLDLTLGEIIFIHKERWLSYQIKKLEEAKEKKERLLLCLFDREEALFFQTENSHCRLLSQIKGEVEKKEKRALAKGNFYLEINKILLEYYRRLKPRFIILASPAFYKEDLLKIVDKELKQRIALASVSDVSRAAVNELLRRPEVREALRKSRLYLETSLIDSLLTEINKNGLAVYGFEETKKAVESGAVKQLLILDSFIRELKEKNEFEKVDCLIHLTEQNQGEAFLISDQNQPGQQLRSLGGIAGLLRYKYIL